MKKDKQHNGQNEKGQTTIHKALHRKLKIEQHEPRLQLGVNSGAPDKFVKISDLCTLSNRFIHEHVYMTIF
jgi:hypothetical protein